MKRPGRRLEPDKFKIEHQIAALVWATRQRVATFDEARALVADELETSLDTVRRAFRWLRDHPAMHGGALAIEFERRMRPDEFAVRIATMRARLAEIKRSRGR